MVRWFDGGEKQIPRKLGMTINFVFSGFRAFVMKLNSQVSLSWFDKGSLVTYHSAFEALSAYVSKVLICRGKL